MDQPMAIVLAAGQGTRMNSDLPKVLFPACGRPLIAYVIDALRAAGVRRIVTVIGYRADLVRQALAAQDVEFAVQQQQRGTGDAVRACLPQLEQHQGPAVVLAGDSPLAQAASLSALLEIFDRERPACLLGTLHKQDPTGLGRIVRDQQGEFAGIVEEKDATDEQRQITEVNMSTYLFDSHQLRHALGQLRDDNRQGEFYLTDCPGILKREGKGVSAHPLLQPCEALSVNTPQELALVEAEMRRMGYGEG